MACPSVRRGAIVIDAGAHPVLTGNIFHGVQAESLTGLTPAERAAGARHELVLVGGGTCRAPRAASGQRGDV